MRPSIVMLGLIVVWCLTTMEYVAFSADDAALVSQAEPVFDVVTLKDGSVIHGEVVEMTGGLLVIKSVLAADLIKVKWSEVTKLAVSHPLPFHLKEGTILK